MKRIFIVFLLFIATFNFFAQTFEQYIDKETLSIYEEWLRRDLNDEKLNVSSIRLYKFDYLKTKIYRIFLKSSSERYFRNYSFPMANNNGYCILDENDHFINLWKNGKELQKLIKSVDMKSLSPNDKKEFLNFIYHDMTDIDNLWSEIINSFTDLNSDHSYQVKTYILKKYKSVIKPIQITDSSIEFYAITGGAFVIRQGKAVYDLKKIVLTFDDEIGLVMQETLLEEDVYEKKP